MRVAVVPVPHGCIAGGSMVFEAVDDHLDGCGGIGHKHEVKLVWIGVEEAQGAIADLVDAVTSDCGRCRGGVGVTIEVGNEVRRELLHQGFGVQLGIELVMMRDVEASLFNVQLFLHGPSTSCLSAVGTLDL